MINFSFKTQAFYDLTLNYGELPDDLIPISAEQHDELQTALNSGCIVFANLTYSAPKPSQFHSWNGSEWVDSRTEAELKEYERSMMPTLSPLEFDLLLDKHDLYDAVQDLIVTNRTLKIAYNRASFFARLDPFIIQASTLMGLTPEQVDAMWLSV